LDKSNVEKYLRYETETGDFYWIANTNPRGPSKVGEMAGCVNAIGYWVIGLFGMHLLGHRLAWLFVHGYMPDNIDHINGKRWDNRIENLRECSNARNIAAGWKIAKGYEVHGAKYRVRLVVDGFRHEIGSFDTSEEAIAAHKAARQNLLGEFA
jgi:hypothetical protein